MNAAEVRYELFKAASRNEDVHEAKLDYPKIGDPLTFQILTDDGRSYTVQVTEN